MNEMEVAYGTNGSCLQKKWKLLMKRMEVAYVFADIMQKENRTNLINRLIFDALCLLTPFFNTKIIKLSPVFRYIK